MCTKLSFNSLPLPLPLTTLITGWSWAPPAGDALPATSSAVAHSIDLSTLFRMRCSILGWQSPLRPSKGSLPPMTPPPSIRLPIDPPRAFVTTGGGPAWPPSPRPGLAFHGLCSCADPGQSLIPLGHFMKHECVRGGRQYPGRATGSGTTRSRRNLLLSPDSEAPELTSVSPPGVVQMQCPPGAEYTPAKPTSRGHPAVQDSAMDTRPARASAVMRRHSSSKS
mmetsp:Transcript_5801/g.14384  ORF Transcript_5801/g.14384 Transcript_5801/m.14384 type:complete len:223 (+) Transcript_5801:697-1365(+)